MAGVKGRSGGSREGAGRKPIPEDVSEIRDPLEFLLDVMQGFIKPSPDQLKAAQTAAQYTHVKKSEGGKKEQKQDAAQKVKGRFERAAPPRLVASGGKPV